MTEWPIPGEKPHQTLSEESREKKNAQWKAQRQKERAEATEEPREKENAQRRQKRADNKAKGWKKSEEEKERGNAQKRQKRADDKAQGIKKPPRKYSKEPKEKANARARQKRADAKEEKRVQEAEGATGDAAQLRVPADKAQKIKRPPQKRSTEWMEKHNARARQKRADAKEEKRAQEAEGETGHAAQLRVPADPEKNPRLSQQRAPGAVRNINWAAVTAAFEPASVNPPVDPMKPWGLDNLAGPSMM